MGDSVETGGAAHHVVDEHPGAHGEGAGPGGEARPDAPHVEAGVVDHAVPLEGQAVGVRLRWAGG